MHHKTLIKAAKEFSDVILKIDEHNHQAFDDAIELILNTKGHLIVCGVGKSGLIGQKISASLSSTGTPSFFMHPVEALHGDLGMVTKDDLLLLISNSGASSEILALLPAIKGQNNKIISMVSNIDSKLAKASDVVLYLKYEMEFCPNNLAPTTSTLLTLAMGDALTVALIEARGFQADDFAKFHPGGHLGRKLLTRVKDVMHTDQLPFADLEMNLHEVLLIMTQGRMGLCMVLKDQKLAGILTDGDVRRALLKQPDALNQPVRNFMSKDPVTIALNALLSEAETVMRQHKVKQLVAIDESGEIQGLLEIFD